VKSSREIIQKIDWLLEQKENFTDVVQLAMLEQDIQRLEWVLGTGPDVILVPKPHA